MSCAGMRFSSPILFYPAHFLLSVPFPLPFPTQTQSLPPPPPPNPSPSIYLPACLFLPRHINPCSLLNPKPDSRRDRVLSLRSLLKTSFGRSSDVPTPSAQGLNDFGCDSCCEGDADEDE